MDIETITMDYLSLMSKPARGSMGVRNGSEHFWHSHFSLCREHLNEYYEGIERRNALSRRVSRLHKMYRQKKRSW